MNVNCTGSYEIDKIKVEGMPTYANNAAAKVGGLVDGDTYRDGNGVMMVVFT